MNCGTTMIKNHKKKTQKKEINIKNTKKKYKMIKQKINVCRMFSNWGWRLTVLLLLTGDWEKDVLKNALRIETAQLLDNTEIYSYGDNSIINDEL